MASPAAGAEQVGRLPIHMLVSRGPHCDPVAVDRLCGLAKNSVSFADRAGRTPLHLACSVAPTHVGARAAPPASLEVVEALLRPWTGAAACKEKDAGGNTPLHCAAVAACVVDAFAGDGSGGLAEAAAAAEAVVVRLLKAWPAAAAQMNSRMATPLHMAAPRAQVAPPLRNE